VKQTEPVSIIMAKNIIKLNLSDDLTKAEVLFKKHKIRHIPVVNEYKIVGSVQLTDLLRVSMQMRLMMRQRRGIYCVQYVYRKSGNGKTYSSDFSRSYYKEAANFS
jgi:signal-transduction protein with cAMP-binding, CBS, and nucleotidyltransferase domain